MRGFFPSMAMCVGPKLFISMVHVLLWNTGGQLYKSNFKDYRLGQTTLIHNVTYYLRTNTPFENGT